MRLVTRYLIPGAILVYGAWPSGDMHLFLVTVAVTVPASGLLVLADRYLLRRKSPEWMSRYHLGLAVLFGAGLVGVAAFALR